MRRNHFIIGTIALVVVTVASHFAWNRHQTNVLRNATMARIDTATQSLRSVLAPTADPVSKSQAIAAAVERVDQDLAALRAADTSRILLLGAGADTYLHATRELLKRQTALLVLESGLRHGIAAFRDHLQHGNRSSSSWTSTAVAQKNRLEQDFREFRGTADAHARILDGLPDSLKALLPLVPEQNLVTAREITALRAATQSLAAAVTSEMEALRRIAAPR